MGEATAFHIVGLHSLFINIYSNNIIP